MPNPEITSKIINSCYEPKLKDMQLSAVISIIGYWRALVGAIKDVDQLQPRLEASFLQQQFGNLSQLDVNNALELFMSNSLDIDIPEFITFSTLHISRILTSYLKYKTKTVMIVDESARKEIMLLDLSAISDRMKGIADCIRLCHQHAQDEFKERFFNQLVFDFLRRTGKMKLSKDTTNNAQDYANKKYAEDRKLFAKAKEDKPHSIASIFYWMPAVSYPKEKAIRLYGIDYCLKLFFKRNDVEKVIKSVTEEDLTKSDKIK